VFEKINVIFQQTTHKKRMHIDCYKRRNLTLNVLNVHLPRDLLNIINSYTDTLHDCLCNHQVVSVKAWRILSCWIKLVIIDLSQFLNCDVMVIFLRWFDVHMYNLDRVKKIQQYQMFGISCLYAVAPHIFSRNHRRPPLPNLITELAESSFTLLQFTRMLSMLQMPGFFPANDIFQKTTCVLNISCLYSKKAINLFVDIWHDGMFHNKPIEMICFEFVFALIQTNKITKIKIPPEWNNVAAVISQVNPQFKLQRFKGIGKKTIHALQAQTVSQLMNLNIQEKPKGISWAIWKSLKTMGAVCS
jgi:hypothetical protein